MSLGLMTHLQAPVLTQIVLTSSVVVSSSISSPRCAFTNLWHLAFKRPISLQMEFNFVVTLCRNKREKMTLYV